MPVNPLLKQLGLSDTDRVVIFHTDDIGMCEASVSAFADLNEFGLISSASVMVPCPWFSATAAYCRTHPGVDMGVHLTLTCEWDKYRWGPISTRSDESGLLDPEGYFYRSVPEVNQHANLEAVQTEIATQLKRALDAGIDATHIDTHMLTLFRPRFVASYAQLGIHQQIPPFLLRLDAAGYTRNLGTESADAEALAKTIAEIDAQGVPMFDSVIFLPLDRHENRLEEAKRILDNCPVGITYFISHPSKDSPELRAIAPDWRSRVADYDVFSNEALRKYVKNSGIQVIGYRAIKEIWQHQTQ